jgi:hypothetical protein
LHIALLGSLNLFQIFALRNTSSSPVWMGVIAGIVATSVAVFSRHELVIRQVGLIIGLLCGVVVVIGLISIMNAEQNDYGLVSMAAGPWIAFLGCSAMVFGGLPRRFSARLRDGWSRSRRPQPNAIVRSAQEGGRPPVPLAHHRHRRRNEQGPDHVRVDGDRERRAEAEVTGTPLIRPPGLDP